MIDVNQLPPPPPAVVEYAHKNGCDKVVPNRWSADHPYKGYVVYRAIRTKDGADGFILLKAKEMRFATEEESKEIRDAIF